MPRYKLTLAYDGTAYSGWQVQPNGVSVQEKLETALAAIAREPCKAHGSGRTDRGVHARRQIAHADLGKPWDPAVLMRGVNALLPPDIRVTALARAAQRFHARRDATAKEYRYFIWNGPVLPPFLLRYRCHVKTPLDIAAMRCAARHLTGRHDFSAFSANPRREVESCVRTVFALDVLKKGPELEIRACGDGFLYKMVRSLAGFLIRAGEGAVAPETAADILASRERTARVPTAPARGLFLWRVSYAPGRRRPCEYGCAAGRAMVQHGDWQGPGARERQTGKSL